MTEPHPQFPVIHAVTRAAWCYRDERNAADAVILGSRKRAQQAGQPCTESLISGYVAEAESVLYNLRESHLDELQPLRENGVIDNLLRYFYPSIRREQITGTVQTESDARRDPNPWTLLAEGRTRLGVTMLLRALGWPEQARPEAERLLHQHQHSN